MLRLISHPIVSIKLIALLLSLACVLARPHLPPKKLSIYTSDDLVANLYADETWGGTSSATWIDEGQNHWLCRLTQSQFFPVCGYSISFLRDDLDRRDAEAYNLSNYQELELTLHYKGEAPKLRVYLRNHNDKYSDLMDDDSYKFNAFDINTDDINDGPVRIHLSEFVVATWWLEERKIPRELSAPELTNVVALGVDLPAPHVFGKHEIRVEKIEFIGEWVSAEALYFYLLLILLGLIALDLLSSLYTKRKNDQASAENKKAANS